ncbi:hypothetical protein AXI58_00750 [Bacillus nakamurai]|uniref:HesB/YadR/YfhF family protein n=1 Tax=Bacillus nakamurai TaxID=1793963 RepID=A0A150F7M6_9BACI|nr:hypothetical protein [Bacillus nakamurai]KXZ20531.1 hypothetical protein AXI58_00750 [Bacillus nakamurai]
MKFSVSTEAAKWFIDEFDLEPDAHVRFLTKIYGGIPTVYPDYYLGMSVGEKGDAIFKVVVENIIFYIDNRDAWLLDEYNLNIELRKDEVEYIFTKSEDK